MMQSAIFLTIIREWDQLFFQVDYGLNSTNEMKITMNSIMGIHKTMHLKTALSCFVRQMDTGGAC